jgi:probable DNA metabolism protein
LIYDSTFEGFLTTIFEIYDRKIEPINIICKRERQIHLFSLFLEIVTDVKQSDRVWNGIKKWVAREGMLMIYHAFLSQENQIELKLYHLIKEILDTKQDATYNMSNMNTFDVLQAKRRVTKEAQRMLMFVRFQRTADDVYFSVIDPMYDVLPLIIDHFKARFSDQLWLIFDTKREYGIYYNLKETSRVTFSEANFNLKTGEIKESMVSEDQEHYGDLWKVFFKATTIKERKNHRLQKQLMPVRYWKFLTEMQV